MNARLFLFALTACSTSMSNTTPANSPPPASAPPRASAPSAAPASTKPKPDPEVHAKAKARAKAKAKAKAKDPASAPKARPKPKPEADTEPEPTEDPIETFRLEGIETVASHAPQTFLIDAPASFRVERIAAGAETMASAELVRDDVTIWIQYPEADFYSLEDEIGMHERGGHKVVSKSGKGKRFVLITQYENTYATFVARPRLQLVCGAGMLPTVEAAQDIATICKSLRRPGKK